MTRLFIGTFVSERDQDKLAQIRKENAEIGEVWQRKVRWVKAEKMHMTWVFLGSVNQELMHSISDMLSNLVSAELNRNVNKEPMKISFDHGEIWPDKRKARQIVLRPSELDERILKLGDVLRNGLREFYFEQQKKEERLTFRPHLTLMRIEKQERPAFSRTPIVSVKLSHVEGLAAALPVVLELDKISLIESQLGKNAEYKVLHEVAMAPAR